MLLMKDIWKLAHNLNIYIFRLAYRKVNGTIDCLAKKGIAILESSVWRSNFPKDLINVSFKDYCGPFSNRVCKISIMKSSFTKKKKKKKTPSSIPQLYCLSWPVCIHIN